MDLDLWKKSYIVYKLAVVLVVQVQVRKALFGRFSLWRDVIVA